MKPYSTKAAVISLLILTASGVRADNRYFTGIVDTDWDTNLNWSSDGCDGGGTLIKPATGDRVVICEGKTVTNVATVSVVSLEIRQAAVLNMDALDSPTLTILNASGLYIRAGGTLKVTEGAAGVSEVVLSGGGVSVIDGSLILVKQNSTLEIGQNAVLGGLGVITGQDNGALIKISNNKTLTNRMRIEGQLEITRVGGQSASTAFINDGLVHANASGGGTIKLNNVTFRGTGEFRISGNNANEIWFAAGDATQLRTFFNVLQGILDIDVPFYTGGGLCCVDGGTNDDCVQCDPGAGEQCTFVGDGSPGG